MSIEIIITIVILAVTFALLLLTRISPVAIFVGALTMTITCQLAPLQQSLKGFSNSGVLTIAALFMVAAGMYSTGAITIISEWLIGRPKKLISAQLKILPSISFGSAFLNNTPLVAMMIPGIRDLAKNCGLPATKLYIPLSYASILGGTCTLIGTATNLVIGGMMLDAMEKAGPGSPFMRELTMFDPGLIGLPVTITGLVFIITVGKWLLPNTKEMVDHDENRRFYRAEFTVEKGSAVIGSSIDDLGYLSSSTYYLNALYRADGSQVSLAANPVLRQGDMLVFTTDLDNIETLWSTNGLIPVNVLHKMKSPRYQHTLVTVVVSRRALSVGRLVSELPLEESPYRMNVVAASRGTKPLETSISNHRIQAGDLLVLEVGDSFFYQNRREIDFLAVKKLSKAKLQRTDRAVAAGLITISMVAVVALGFMSMLNAALLASGLMVLTGCMSLKEAGQSVEFGTVVVIASAIGLEAAVTSSGLSAILADFFAGIGGGNPTIALIVVFCGCIFMDTLVTNVASAVFMFPIALMMAEQMSVSFMPFAMTVLVGASCSFISPVGYQTNLMVYGPGGYSFIDYVKIGVPLTVIVGIVTILLTPLFFPF